MPKYESTLGTRQIPNQPMRDLSVPDAGDLHAQQSLPPSPQMRHRDRHAPPVLDQAAFQDFQARMQPPPPQSREMTPEEESILAAKKARREGKERLSEGARRRIEMLIGMTRLSKVIDIDGQMYKLQTLTSQELRDAVVGSAEFDGTVQFIFETRKQLLARSMVVVAGVEIDQFLYSSDLDARLYFIEQMDHALLLRLYDEYVILSKEAQNKYSLKTEAQVKETVEDLKKP